MQKTSTSGKIGEERILVTLAELKEILGAGRQSCLRIALAANSAIKVGDRRLYNLSLIRQYLDTNCGGNDREEAVL